MRNITNSTQLNAALKQIAKIAINEVAPEVLGRLQSNIIDYTYSFDPSPRTWYHDKTGVPTYEFLNAFMFGNMKDSGNQLSKELYYNYNSMDYDPATFKHAYKESGNVDEPGGRFVDMRKYLADILNVNGVDSFNNFGGRLRAPYWDITIVDLFSSAEGMSELDILFTKALRKFGGI